MSLLFKLHKHCILTEITLEHMELMLLKKSEKVKAVPRG